MSAYSQPIGINFGPLHSGLTGSLAYTVYDADGSVKIAATTIGISELAGGSGLYGASVTMQSTWGFVRVVWTVAGQNLAGEQVVNTTLAGSAYVAQAGSGQGVATFDAGLPTDRDRVRFRVGDVSPQPQWFLADASIDAVLSVYDFDEACAQCAEAIGAMCIQTASRIRQRSLQIEYKDRAKSAFELADRIRNLSQPGPDEPANTGAAASALAEPDLRDLMLELPVRHEVR
jgi:hypothetical protein